MAAPAFSHAPRAKRGDAFRFVHLTDLHLREGNGAPDGIALAVRKVLALRPRPEFVLVGGDVVEGLMGAEAGLAHARMAKIEELLKPLEMPVHYAIGNHDVFGWSRVKASTSNEPGYGKAMFAERMVRAPLYRSFDHRGWHFVVLDSIQFDPSEERGYVTRIDDDQLAWLAADLGRATGKPTVVMTHAPLLSGYHSLDTTPYGPFPGKMLLVNGKDVNEVLKKHDVRLVLQGHTHIRECVEYAGRKHITSGAVCGNWWGGKRFDVDPEGFSVIDLTKDGHIDWTYEPTGWRAIS